MPAPAPVVPDGPPSLIVLGYGNAMYRLGWRYETGHGTTQNVPEAVRCYFKAAKLGNPAAMARLTPRDATQAEPSARPPPARALDA